MKREWRIVGIFYGFNPFRGTFAGKGAFGMLKRRYVYLALLGLLAACARMQAADSSAVPPTLVIRVRSIDSLIADVKYLTSLSGRGNEVRALDAALKRATPNGFEGIDDKRPIGLYGLADQDGNLQETKVVLLVPVSDEKTVIGLLGAVQL